MSILLDGLVLFILLLSVVVSYKKGLIRTLLSVVSFFVSFFVAGYLSKWLASFFFKNFLSKSINENIINKISEVMQNGGMNSAIEKINQIIPDWITNNLLNGQKVPQTSINMLAQNNIEGAANSITTQVVEPIVTMLISIVLFFIIFILIKLIFRFIFKFSRVFDRIPVVGLINGLLGGVFGVVRAALYLMLLSIIVWMVILLTSDQLQYLNTETVNNTSLFLLFYKLNPLVSL